MRFELPNYFLADLEDELVLTPTLVTEACQTIKTNRIQYLANRSTQSIINTLNDLGQSWLEEDNPYRRIALEKGVEATGFPEQVLARGLNAFFEQLTAQNLEELIIQDLGHINRLDEPVPSSAAYMSRRYAIATGPELIAHITAGNIPTPAIMSIVLGLL
ncbi:MAG: acyl-CoA reductase, partial [Limisphaerales bacterium]